MNQTVKIILAIILTALVIGGGTYYYLNQTCQTEIGNLETEKDDLNDRVSTLQSQLNELQRQVSSSDGLTVSFSERYFSSKKFGIVFYYPKDWYVIEDKSESRIYVRNVEEKTGKFDGRPLNFQQIWISTAENEASEEVENGIKNSETLPSHGSIITETIDNKSFKINTYEYDGPGGPQIKAFWEDNSGNRYYATNSTEVGQENQEKMIENLKLILSTIDLVAYAN